MAAANARKVRMGTGTAQFNQTRSPHKGPQTPRYNALTSHVSLCVVNQFGTQLTIVYTSKMPVSCKEHAMFVQNNHLYDR